MFFDTWIGLASTFLVGTCAYAALLFLVRISGKRTLSKMNAFDLIVTIALGSTLPTILLSKDIALAEGVLAIALLISLQLIIVWLSVCSENVSRLIKAEPSLLFNRREFLWSAMKKERVNKGELLQAVRRQGISSLGQVEAVVLETDGSFSVLQKTAHRETNALSNLYGNGKRGTR